MGKVSLAIQLLRNMGVRYVMYRIYFMVKTRLGVLKRQFPDEFPSLAKWRDSNSNFFIDFEEVKIEKYSEEALHELAENVKRIHEGEIQFFSYEWFKVTDWFTHPVSGYVYPKVHFTEIEDFSEKNGDIKYAWEKARFSWVYTLIRYQKQTGNNQATFIFEQIERFINENPLNIGPQYKCSQEMSLRVFNWTFVLFFYKNDSALTETLYNKILKSISGHYHHVYHNINFSRIAVRNNHAITETLALHLISKWYPFLPNSSKWGKKGKAWFEEEVAYQLYEDGGFLQYSHNYHRVVVQLLTWALLQAKKDNETYKPVVKQRAKVSYQFLQLLVQKGNGWLPNYGQNDGALFFPLNAMQFRDYRPQLNALASVLNLNTGKARFEDEAWYGIKGNVAKEPSEESGLFSFDSYGQYVMKDSTSLTVINNPSYFNRPAQSDQLHLDIHVNGQNILFDPGTYKYNTDKEFIDFFFGTGGHNTVQLGIANQMLKGARFIWYNWVKETGNRANLRDGLYEYTGWYNGFVKETGGMRIERKVIKHENKLSWVIFDTIDTRTKHELMKVHWNVLPIYQKVVHIKAFDEEGEPVHKQERKAWNSTHYGRKEEFNQIEFSTSGNYIRTEITINEDIINSSVFS